MDMLAQFGYFGNLSPTDCYLYGMVYALMAACLALNTKKPEKED